MNMIHRLSQTPSRPPIPFSASELQSARRRLLLAPTTATSTATMVPKFLFQVLQMKERPFDPLPNYEERAHKRRRVCPDVPSSTKEW
eukprot:scaffold2097_cov63-Cylindrotheca_fusiformis.AAC.1